MLLVTGLVIAARTPGLVAKEDREMREGQEDGDE